MSGIWYAILPETSTAGNNQIVLDPSAESGLAAGGSTYAAENGAAVTQDTTYARFGIYSYKVVMTGLTNSGMRLTTKAAANAIHYYSFYVHGTVTGALQVSMDAGVNYNAAAISGGSSGGWVRYGVSIPAAQANASTSTRIRDTLDDGTLYFDGFMCQAVNYATTYIDGSIYQCRWNGLAHQSTSYRDPQGRYGGRLIDIEATYNCKIQSWFGAGMPPMTNETQNLAFQPGSQYNNTKINNRLMTLIVSPLTGGASTIGAFHSIRKNLVNLFNPERYRNKQPITLAYFGANSATGAYCSFRYDSGLELGEALGRIEKIPVRLIAEDPFWREDNQETAALGLTTSLTSNNYAAARIDGTWQNLGTGFSGDVLAISVDSIHNRIYCGGIFATANGITVNDICYWDGYLQTFVAMDSGIGGGTVSVICIAANGDVWIGGSFTQVGSGAAACTGLARWNYATSTWTAFNVSGAAGNKTVYAISISPDTGDVLIGGDFLNYGSAAGDYIVRYQVSDGSFNALSSGTGGVVQSILAVSSTEIYIGGNFINLGDANGDYIVKWTGSAWVSLATGASGVVYTLVRKPNGNIIAGGSFSITPTTSYIAEWNGSKWSALSTGLNNIVYSLSINSNGLLIAGGVFTTAGGVSLSDRVALWNGTSWLQLDIDLPGVASIFACAWNGDDIYLGYNTTGTATVANQVTGATVSPSSTALTYPILTITGPTTANALMTLQWLENYSQRCRIYLNMIIQAGEIVTFNFTPGHKRVTSSFGSTGSAVGGPGTRGGFDQGTGSVVYVPSGTDRTKDVLSPSEFVRFALLPGQNTINFYASGTTTGAKALLNWRPCHLSVDGVAA